MWVYKQFLSFLYYCIFFSTKNEHVLFQEMKNNPVHLITEEDLKQISSLESTNTNKKDKKDERRRKATGNKLLLIAKFHNEFFICCSEHSVY